MEQGESSKRGRPRLSISASAKKIKKSQQRDNTRISLLSSYNRWKQLMVSQGIPPERKGGDAMLADMLMDFWFSQHQVCSESEEQQNRAVSTPLKGGASDFASLSFTKPDSESSISSIDEIKSDEHNISGVDNLNETDISVDVKNTSDATWAPGKDELDDFVIDMSLRTDNPVDVDNLFTLHELNMKEIEAVNVAEEEQQPHEHETNRSHIKSLDDTRNLTAGIAYDSCLLELLQMQAPVVCPTCGENNIDTQFSKVATAINIKWVCPQNHVVKRWYSQPNFKNMNYGDFVLSTNILLSGNNFEKIEHLLSFCKFGCVSKSTHYRIQALYTCPSIETFWAKTVNTIIEKYRGKEVVVIGDGRNDSPGHSAQYMTYTLMDHDSNDVLSQHIIDKREVNLKSPNMEKLGLIRCLAELEENVKIVELVTDAHVQIGAYMRRQHGSGEGKIIHQFDVWHGCKNFVKKLSEAAEQKQNKPLIPWIQPLANHFWFSCQMAKGNTSVLERTLFSAPHHVVGEHVWSTGNCSHVVIEIVNGEEKISDNADVNPDRPYLTRGSPAAKALDRILHDSNFIKNIPRYVNFRHTGALESYHNVILAYASKRQSYQFTAFQARNRLAALDFQMNKRRGQLCNADGNPVWHKHFNKKSNNWSAEKMLVAKCFDYIEEIQDIIIIERLNDSDSIYRKKTMKDNDPRRLQKTIAKVAPPPMEDLVKFKSRFSDK